MKINNYNLTCQPMSYDTAKIRQFIKTLFNTDGLTTFLVTFSPRFVAKTPPKPKGRGDAIDHGDGVKQTAHHAIASPAFAPTKALVGANKWCQLVCFA